MAGDAALKLDSGTAWKCKPFVKWAGGKGQLLPELIRRVPSRINNYFEPFVGSGALFFELQPESATLSDINADLINAYCVVRDRVEKLISSLAHHRYEKRYYYKVRAQDRLPLYAQFSPVERASRLIYLNKTCFNGLYRVNSAGHFNVPFGRYTNPTICDSENLKGCSAALAMAKIECASFLTVERKAKRGDFVYFDPPYFPISKTSSFAAYAEGGFGEEAHTDLRDLCRKLDKKGVRFMLSNSDAAFVRDLFKDFQVETVKAGRAINSKAAKRGKIDELIITNY